MKALILFGPPGSGKGTQAQILASKFKLVSVSIVDILKNEVAKNSELGVKVGEFLKKGVCVSDEIIFDLIRNFIELHKDSNGFVFDGFPRTIKQAEELKNLFNSFGISSVNVINLQVYENEVVKRLVQRAENLGKSEDIELIKNKLRNYEHTNSKILDFMCNNCGVFDINGMGKIDEVNQNIVGALGVF
ncbi:MAG: nucleoside monophosphate kinase [Nanoarchaeota archaeon]